MGKGERKIKGKRKIERKDGRGMSRKRIVYKHSNNVDSKSEKLPM